MKITLPLRRYTTQHVTESHEIDLSAACLVIVDAWGYHPHARYMRRSLENQRTKLQQLLSLAREHGIMIVHLPHAQPISNYAAPRPGEAVIDTNPPCLGSVRDALAEYLLDKPIRTLIFAGYASNWCLLNAITSVHPLGYDIILVRDCTVALETEKSLDGEWCNYVAINMIEQQWGASVSLAELREALRPVDAVQEQEQKQEQEGACA